MRVIHKKAIYAIPGPHVLRLSHDAKIISVANQNNKLVVYYETDIGKDQEWPQELTLVFTGRTPPLSSRFIGTVLLDEGECVVHCYAEDND